MYAYVCVYVPCVCDTLKDQTRVPDFPEARGTGGCERPLSFSHVGTGFGS